MVVNLRFACGLPDACFAFFQGERMKTGLVRRLVEISLGPLTIRRRLPSEAGASAILVSAKVGGLKYLLKGSRFLDPELLRIAGLLIRSGETVWDVGANVGLFSRAASYHAGANGRVLCIEADVDAVVLLNRTCRLPAPGHADMTVLPVAISDADGFVRFAVAKRARAANSIEGYGSTQTGGVRELRTLPCASLDKLLEHFPAPHLVKIDVEGAEALALQGGARLLGKIRPAIYCEVQKESQVEVTRLLRQHSYKLWDGEEFRGTCCPETGLATTNTVAIPIEKVERYA